eukprot:4817134-Alexandrium_andersonii.AAC.1
MEFFRDPVWRKWCNGLMLLHVGWHEETPPRGGSSPRERSGVRARPSGIPPRGPLPRVLGSGKCQPVRTAC